jgi:L-lactate dehydrogenase complex protein LldF
VTNAESRGAQLTGHATPPKQTRSSATWQRNEGAHDRQKQEYDDGKTHLNVALEATDIQVVETDLGEYIIQLAEETPSHIIVPAIHKTKRQIAELFTEELGMPPTDDVDKLTRTAREQLRNRFAAADIGISGVNFGIAETGTIVILENEGNIRLTTSLPRVHIAVMGIEKSCRALPISTSF